MRLTKRQNVSMTCIAASFNSDNTKITVSDAFGNLHIYHNINSDSEDGTDSGNNSQDEMADIDSPTCHISTINLETKFGKKNSATNLTNYNDEFFLFTAGNGLYKCSWTDINDITRLEKCQAGFKKIVKTQTYILTLLGDNRILFSHSSQTPSPNNFQDLRIILEDDCRIFDTCSAGKDRLVIGVSDSEHKSVAQIYDISGGKGYLKKSIKLSKQPVDMDCNESFGVFAYRKTKKDRSFAELVHLESGEIVKTLELGQETENGSKNVKNSAYAALCSIHSARFHEPTGTIVLGSFGNTSLKLYDSNGEYRKDLTCGFNTSCLTFGNTSESIMAAAGFSNKIDLFYDLTFKSHSLAI